MAEISWIKLKTTMFDDEKIRLIQAVPEADAILVIWIRLLVLAGKTNDDGLIYIQRNMPYSEEMLATLFGKNVNTVRLALTTLANFNMIDISNDGVISISNWEKHQNIEGMEQVRLKNAERNRKYRERKKQELLESKSDVSVTSRDATDIDKELDKERDIDKEKDVMPSKTKAKPTRHKYGEYKNVLLSDEQLEKLKKEFPADWEARIERVSSYCESTGKSYKNYFATIKNWAKKDHAGNRYGNKRVEKLPSHITETPKKVEPEIDWVAEAERSLAERGAESE
ncbi:phage replisome organizer N-terminal domain-containing protein [Enterococcus avium]|uniref:phage replisome organizer N-terminal domain-containing protein n=1 Tax=Enterococcus avium TaxID=33945 RepID=UPI00288F8AC9|nr:phage replisome organizer N-terminal domain-containing protein [Enterococcus avium]MDT2437925.1 phage replisome organizer N-terminal domain-containing protein [Enterococcus avium]